VHETARENEVFIGIILGLTFGRKYIFKVHLFS
jgi:hypothetical protein